MPGGVTCTFDGVGAATGLKPEHEHELLRIAQEAVTNILRHAAARSIWVKVEVIDSLLHLCIRDDGRGFDVSQESARRRGSVGLELLRALVAEHDGTLDVGPSDHGGTTLLMELPYRAEVGS